jgi:hypothetical protein
MVQYGRHSPEEVVAGCAWRHEYLWQMQARAREKPSIKNILVVLEGLTTMPGFVKFIYEALDGETSYRTILRPHPEDTAERVIAEAGIPLSEFQSLDFSTNQAISQDLEDADLVIYRGSTSCIEAGYLGIPLIHVEPQILLNNDPLFETSSLKRIARTPEELILAIQSYSAMDVTEYLRQCDALREYIDGYFVKPTEAHTMIFLSNPSVENLPC